jgi:AcrR family transcriptional regulator
VPHARFEKLAPERRDALLAAASAEFAAHGFRGASMNRIIEQSGLSKGSTYYYFDGKEDLFFTVLEGAMDKVLAAMGEWDAWRPEQDTWVALEEFSRRLLRVFMADPQMSALLRAMSPTDEPMASEALAKMYAKFDGFVIGLIEHGQRRGDVRQDLPFELLVRLLMTLFEALDRWMLDRLDEIDGDRIDELAALVVDLTRRVAAP